MKNAGRPLLALACCAAIALVAIGCDAGGGLQRPDASPPTGLEPSLDSNAVANFPATDATNDPNSPSLDMKILKSMLYAAGIKHSVNPYLVMGLAWHESGWQESIVSPAGAVGIMQVMPATASVDGPKLLGRTVNLYDPGDNIDLGTAILKHNLDAYNDDLPKALCAYFAGGGAVTEWANMRADCRRYVWAVYNAAVMFRDGKGPV